jgi:hypothetical protein
LVVIGRAGGTGVGAGVQAGDKVIKPLFAPMYWTLWPNESTSPTSSAVGGAARSVPAAARVDKIRAKFLRMLNFI